MTNEITKFRLGGDIFDQRMILVSLSWTQCLTIQPLQQQSFPCSRQSIIQYHSAWCTAYQDSTLYVSICLVSGKRKGEERERERESKKPLLATIIFVFLVECTAMLFHTWFCSTTRNWRKLYKNQTVLSSLDAKT